MFDVCFCYIQQVALMSHVSVVARFLHTAQLIMHCNAFLSGKRNKLLQENMQETEKSTKRNIQQATAFCPIQNIAVERILFVCNKFENILISFEEITTEKVSIQSRSQKSINMILVVNIGGSLFVQCSFSLSKFFKCNAVGKEFRIYYLILQNANSVVNVMQKSTDEAND